MFRRLFSSYEESNHHDGDSAPCDRDDPARNGDVPSTADQHYNWPFRIADDRVMDALERIPRAEFLPHYERAYAHENRALPIAHGQTISQPYIVALMSRHLELKPDKRILEIGTGSGYQAAVLAELCAEVFTVEVIPELSETARQTLERLGYTNIHFRVGDGSLGWPEQAPFDGIIVTCAAPGVPEPLWNQLRAPAGRFVIPIGDEPNNQELFIFRKVDNGAPVPSRSEGELICPVRFVPLTH